MIQEFEVIPDFLKGTIKLPSNDSQLKHIFEARVI